MEKEKRRSPEEEEELDRKIALIREKNLKIEQRSKEVEEDRINNSVAPTPKKPALASVTQPASNNNKSTGKNIVWDREWDKGKTPADQWRENVPSIELSGKLASAAGQNRRRNTNSQGNNNQAEKVNKGGRLEGRLSVEKDKPAGNNKGRGRRDSNQNQNNSNKKQGESQSYGRNDKVNGAPRKDQRNRRGNPERKSTDNENQNTDATHNQEHKQSRNRNPPRKENDNHTVRMVVKMLVEKVEKVEKRRIREEKAAETADNQPPAENGAPGETVPVQEEKQPPKEAAAAETPVKEESPGKENIETKSDDNQNVIQLTRERVLTVQSS